MRSLSTLTLSAAVLLAAACTRSTTAPPAEATKNDPASTACPDVVKSAVARDFADATMTSCKAETEDGHEQFELKLARAGKQLEIDVAPDGTLLLTETVIAVDELPAKVMTAFSAKYPGAKARKAEKQVEPGKSARFEIEYDAQPKPKEVTFAEDGTFVEEE